jgi:hypothetical protein
VLYIVQAFVWTRSGDVRVLGLTGSQAKAGSCPNKMLRLYNKLHNETLQTSCRAIIKEVHNGGLFSSHTEYAAGPGGRAIQGVGLGRLVTDIVGSNHAGGLDVCLCVSMLCCPV